MESIRPEIDQVLPARARARRWRNLGERRAFAATAHSGVEIAWLEAGGVRYRIDGSVVDLVAGQVMLVPSGVEHASEFLEGMVGGSLHIDDASIAQAADAAGVGIPRLAALLDAGDVSVLGAMLVGELSRGGADAQLCANALVDAVTVKAVRGLPLAKTSPRDPRVRAAVDLIRARFAEPLDVEEIAACCGTTRFHLSRLFKAATGQSPYQFLLAVRLDEAARLLRRGRSVTDAAFSSGFADLSRFARMFHARFGVLPAIYRR
jgi:AraC family transcriptional regulator